MESITYSATSGCVGPRRIIARVGFSIWRSRQLTWMLFKRDLKAQYRQSFLGYFWVVFPPLATTLVWYVLNSQKVVAIETDLPYPLFVLIGTTLWSSFSAAVTLPLNAFIAGGPVFVKLRVPVESFVLSGFLKACFELLVRLVLVLPLFITYEITPPWTIVLLPLGALGILLLGLTVSLLLIPFGALFGDINNALPNLLGVLLYTAPVVYPLRDEGLLGKVMMCNPVSPALAFCRDILTSGSLEWLPATLIWMIISVLAILVAFAVQAVALPRVIERMGM